MFHGINPGMGWRFAVALGLQERRASAVWRALTPLALGHVLAVFATLTLAAAAGTVLTTTAVRWGVGMTLLSLGAYRLMRCRHPRWGGMQAGMKDLTIWSFLMACAHGAGFMVVPFALGMAETTAHAHAEHAGHMTHAAANAGALLPAIVSTAVHSAGYLIVSALMAWIVYAFAGVGILRRAWINLDLIWAMALIVTGMAAVALAWP